MLLTSSDTKQTRMHLFLFTNSVQRELVSICTQSTHNFPCMTTLDMIYYWLGQNQLMINKYAVRSPYSLWKERPQKKYDLCL